MKALLLACALAAGLAHAQDYPSRPVKLILPFPPGGPTDILGRLIADNLSPRLGQPVITENRGGAGGNVGAEAAARSAPDGYTMVLVAPSLAISPTLYAKLNYDPVKDFAPVTLVATVPNVIVTQPSMGPALQDFIGSVKEKPGQFNFGSGGAGTSNHLAGELFNLLAGTKLVHVPYKGVNLAMQDVLAGPIHMVVIGVPAAAPHIRSGRLRALAVIAPQRLAALPDVPTIAEAGLPGFEVTTWYGVSVPAKTPRPIIDKLHSEILRALKSPDVRDTLVNGGADPVGNTPEQYTAFVQNEITKWAKVIKAAGIKGE